MKHLVWRFITGHVHHTEKSVNLLLDCGHVTQRPINHIPTKGFARCEQCELERWRKLRGLAGYPGKSKKK